VASTCFRPGGGRSSNDWTKCPNTIESNGMVMMIPGKTIFLLQNGRKQKSLPFTSMSAFKKQSGMNSSGWSQYFGCVCNPPCIHQDLLSGGRSYPATLVSWRFMWGIRSGIAI